MSFMASNAQMDTIVFLNGGKIGCNVLKLSQTEIEYSYEGESLVNVDYKSKVEKIIFKNGRIQILQQKKEGNPAQFWGIDLGINYKLFVEKLKEKGAKVLEYIDNDEVKLESQFLAFKSADIYVHYNKDGKVYLVDVQQNHAGKMSSFKEMKVLIDTLNASYKLVSSGAKPWAIAFYRWQWEDDNLIITLNRAGGYTRPHLRYHEKSTALKEDEE